MVMTSWLSKNLCPALGISSVVGEFTNISIVIHKATRNGTNIGYTNICLCEGVVGSAKLNAPTVT